MKKQLNIFLALITFALLACEPTYTPKPTGFNNIALPDHKYELYSDSTKPYLFKKNIITEVENYVTDLIKLEDNYVKVNYPTMDASCWITYKEIHNNIDTLNSLIMNSFRLADGHNVKASGIDSEVISIEKDRYATSIILEGEVSSQYQFYVHDSTDNFVRVALYFKTATKNDSLAPVINYIKEDMHQILRTIEWRDAE